MYNSTTENAIHVNSTTKGSQGGAHATKLTNGNLVIAYTTTDGQGRPEYHDGHFQIIAPDGTKVGSELSISAPSSFGLRVQALDNGQFVVGFNHYTNSTYWTTLQTFDASGAVAGSAFTFESKGDFDIASVPGGYMVVYRDRAQLEESLNDTTMAWSFDYAGSAFGPPQTLWSQPYNSSKFHHPKDLVALPSGGVAMLYMEGTSYPTWESSVRVQVLYPDGSRSNPAILDSPDYPSNADDIAVLSDGNFVVTYTRPNYGLVAQRFSPLGEEIGEAIRITGPSPAGGNVAGLSNGDFVVTFSGGGGGHSYAQVVTADGALLGSSFLLHTREYAEGVLPLDDGRFAVVMSINDASDPPEPDVGMRIIEPNWGSQQLGTASGETLTANAAMNSRLDGYAGADVLLDGAGDDTLLGGGGNDTLRSASGDDYLDGGAGTDTLSYAAATSGVTIDLKVGNAQATGGAGSDTIRLMENLIGSRHDDMLTGNAASNSLRGGLGSDTLDGDAGADVLRGDAGDDLYFVDNASDRVLEIAGEGTDTVRSFVSFTLAGQHVENLVLMPWAGEINGTGNGLDNTIEGNSWANVINGGAGADIMIGSIGGDRYVVDNVGDSVREYSFHEGVDRVDASVSFTLAGYHIENLTLTGNASISGTGNELANTIIGNSAGNTINGGADADIMEGKAGNDKYIVDDAGDRVFELADQGIDIVEASVSFSLVGQYIETLRLTGAQGISGTGNNQANSIYGNGAANALNASAGDDKLIGGDGNDSLTGGAGLDRFIFDTALSSSNFDQILDFDVSDDSIYLDRSIFKGVAGGVLSSGAFVLGTAAADAGDRIVYDQGTGNLLYDADGTGAGAAVLFASVTAGTALTNLDFVGF